MESIIHPISGEKGFFLPLKHKLLIDLSVFLLATQLDDDDSSSDARGGDL